MITIGSYSIPIQRATGSIRNRIKVIPFTINQLPSGHHNSIFIKIINVPILICEESSDLISILVKTIPVHNTIAFQIIPAIFCILSITQNTFLIANSLNPAVSRNCLTRR